MTEVAATSGTLRGVHEDGLDVFRGVRFARAARFGPPDAVEPWTGVREATAFGPACPQGSRARQGRASVFGGLFGPGELPTDEECLFLNVWTPGCDDARRPVLVWIHGGAFALGTGASPIYDGSRLARRGDVVVVTLNYRVGPLGFSYLPQDGGVNLGLQDQVAALRWVCDEVEHFGGNPDDVTIFGESAGGKSVECLLAMPSARGLFRKAILQSTYDPPMDPENASERTRRLLGELGDADIRTVPVDELLEAQARAAVAAMAGAPGGALAGTGPVVDGDVLPRLPLDTIAAGEAADVPLLIGTTADEFRLFAAMMGADLDDAALRERLAGLGVDPDRALDTYGRTLPERGLGTEPVDIFAAAMTDRMFRQHSIRVAEAQLAHQPSTWMYLFDHASTAFGGRLRSCHALELPFVFGTLDGPLAELVGSESVAARSLSDAMQDAWLAFARTGKADWPAYDTGSRPTQVFGEGIQVAEDPLRAERELWR